MAARTTFFIILCVAHVSTMASNPLDDADVPRPKRGQSLRGRLLSKELLAERRPRRLLAGGSAASGSGVKKSNPCMMHTYFESINGDAVEKAGNDNLIAKWTEAWEAVGWETRIITEEDAKGHPEYASLREAFYRLPTVSDPGLRVVARGDSLFPWLLPPIFFVQGQRPRVRGGVLPATPGHGECGRGLDG